MLRREARQAHGPMRRTATAAGLAAGLVAVLGMAACGTPPPAPGAPGGSGATPPAPSGGAASAPIQPAPPRTGTPELRVSEVASGLVPRLGPGVPTRRPDPGQRARRQALAAVRHRSPVPPSRRCDADLSDVYARGEGGLMGMVVHPDFAQSRRFTTCQTHMQDGSPTDVRLVTWQLSADGAVRVAGGRPPGRRPADQPVRPPLRLPPDDRRRRRAARRHRRHGPRRHRAGPHVARRQGAADRPGDRRPRSRQPVRGRREPGAAAGLDLRAPQRPGRRRAAGHRRGLREPSTARPPTTRSTFCAPAPTTAGTRRRAASSVVTTSRCR